MKEFLGYSVLNGVVRFFSVSSMEKFDPNTYGGCPSKWHIRYIRGVKEKQTTSKDFGDKVHEQLKHYLTTGQNVLTRRMQPMMKFVPAPGPGLYPEHALSPLVRTSEDIDSGAWRNDGRNLSYAGIPFTGSLDVRNERGEYINESGELISEPGVIEVIDWKTTKSIADYAKTDLKNLIQMTGYADSIARQFPNVERVRLSHVYGQSQDAECAKKITQLIDLTEITARRNYHESIAWQMIDVAREKETKDVPYNLEACTAFRACPYQGICPHFGGGTSKGKVMSLLSRLKAQKTETGVAVGLGGTTTPLPPPAPPVVVTTATTEPIAPVVTATVTAPELVVTTPTVAPPAATNTTEPAPRKRKSAEPKSATVRHTVRINLGNYNHAEISVELTGDNLDELSDRVKAQVDKDSAVYLALKEETK